VAYSIGESDTLDHLDHGISDVGTIPVECRVVGSLPAELLQSEEDRLGGLLLFAREFSSIRVVERNLFFIEDPPRRTFVLIPVTKKWHITF
jgi:hypothetical protein